jgi:hypothetical protein
MKNGQITLQESIPVRRRRLSGIPGSKSPAEWEA